MIESCMNMLVDTFCDYPQYTLIHDRFPLAADVPPETANGVLFGVGDYYPLTAKQARSKRKTVLHVAVTVMDAVDETVIVHCYLPAKGKTKAKHVGLFYPIPIQVVSQLIDAVVGATGGDVLDPDDVVRLDRYIREKAIPL